MPPLSQDCSPSPTLFKLVVNVAVLSLFVSSSRVDTFHDSPSSLLSSQQPQGSWFATHHFTGWFEVPLSKTLIDDDAFQPNPVIQNAIRRWRSANGGHFPGEMGTPVIVPWRLSDAEKDVFNDEWKQTEFNLFASDMVGVRRTLPDVRFPVCRGKQYPTDLPMTSVIMCFYNEAWTPLLRSIYSVIDRSPAHLLKEIILVDDGSTSQKLQAPLDEYMSRFFPLVRIIRSKVRQGLIRARLLGASLAKGDVLTFLDSHIECSPGWLEPLLSRIQENRQAVVTPIISQIDKWNMEFQFDGAKGDPRDRVQVGGFGWDVSFTWHHVPPRHEQLLFQGNPIPSPTMAGGLFSIDRMYFDHLGAYDPDMDIWGGENLELSFRVWMCGGSLETIPCSIVGHIFRSASPYTSSQSSVALRKNQLRLVHTWMDSYKQNVVGLPAEGEFDYGNIQERLELRERLQCKSFEWYHRNVWPELFTPQEAVFRGEIRNKAIPYCLDAQKVGETFTGASVCHRIGGRQFWLISRLGEIRDFDKCLESVFFSDEVGLRSCDESQSQVWQHWPEGYLYNAATKRCLAMSGDKLRMVLCGPSTWQQWWLS
eukprot:TRINITY_DN6485_c0_g2_i1.p1 TRINITY_DN6485_c0_g2~~TRINITY_DN6485_c0_g2_i1.p1  ORF type:complete len:618 (+),score=54.37 TRINITY_DN6485_c0_g2_i1:77-1855(+)